MFFGGILYYALLLFKWQLFDSMDSPYSDKKQLHRVSQSWHRVPQRIALQLI